ncbi:MAG TPA: TIGR03936 family radical SAM-associated protein [Planctomycetota bacterium]|nr:TIGR03936 family radical SAM-associated protein [Planctomycetota bacterium]
MPDSAVNRTRIRLRFTKKAEVRFLSHHDLMRFFERAIRRAGLPVKMSQGYNPRPRFSVAAALGVGVAAEQEILDIELAEPVDPQVVRKNLSATLISGIEIISAEGVEGKPPRAAAAWYDVLLPPDLDIPGDAPQRLFAADEVVVERTGKDNELKRINIRPYILEILTSGRTVRMRLEITDSGSARPDEVVAALAAGADVDRNRLRIVRTALEVQPDKQT